MEGVEVACNTPGCRGEGIQSFPISNKKYIYRHMYRMLYVQGQLKPRFDPRIYGISPTTRREIEKLMSSDTGQNTYPQITQKSVETTIR